MAAFLTQGEVYCHHELLNGLRSRQAFYDAMRPGIGNADCGLALTDFQERWDCPTVIIERPIRDVAESLIRLGMDIRWFLEILNRRLAEVDGLRVDFSQLDDRLPEICGFLGLPYDRQRHDLFRRFNIQLQEISGDPESLRLWC
jgi:hypothetical protein